jgi:Cu/Ag efflux protein CusF
MKPSAATTMSFTIDKNTTVEGKLKVGSNADVTYRQDNGANVAISVHVTP